MTELGRQEAEFYARRPPRRERSTARLRAARARGCSSARPSSSSRSAARCRPTRVRDWVDGFGAAGPLVFIVVCAVLTVALFPGPLLAGASGLLFGTALGTPVAIVAATLGAMLAFCLVALVGARRGRGARRPAPAARGAAARWVERARLPGRPLRAASLPGDAVQPRQLRGRADAGARSARFAAATAIGGAPRAFAYTALGGSLGDLGSPEAIVAIGVLVVMARRRAGRSARATVRRERAGGASRSRALDLEQARRPRPAARQARP